MNVHPLFHIYGWWSGAGFWARRKFTKAGTRLLASILAFSALALDTDFSLAYQVLALLAGLAVVSLALNFRARTHWRIRRLLPRYGSVGQPLHYRLIFPAKAP